MRVKRYIVDTMPEAMQHIRTDLGADAVILSTKETKVGGFLGMFTRKKIEVIAAVEQAEKSKGSAPIKSKVTPSVPSGAVPKAYQRTAEISKPGSQTSTSSVNNTDTASGVQHEDDYSRFAEILSQVAASEETVDRQKDELDHAQQPAAAAKAAMRSDQTETAVSVESVKSSRGRQEEPLSSRLGISESEQRVLEELKEMKEWIARLSRQNLEAQHLPEPLQSIRDQLLKQDLSAKLTEEWLTAAEEAWKANHMQMSEAELQNVIYKQAEAFLEGRIGGGVQPETRIVYIAGPTGVGKTTTIAKIAAEQLFRNQRKVGLITSDTYRISAVEQLRTYASILNVPMEVVQSPGDMQRALQKLQDCDLVLMDTAGRNYRNELLVSELQSLFSHSDQSETYLVLSLTSKSSDMIEIADHFSKYELDKVIFTKMDETGSYGSLFNLIDAHNLRLSYMTNGQNVPDDLLMADSERLCHLLLGEIRT
ncbi:flagellar biosynthesis protein FlhF [Paenibacillus lautus]|uniref:flagellar biosynthesis protein FlhF n=1 Tax=Paenibacillus TaxID=44249 RepID=UPI002DB72D48|nr:flagellar biosynthesis protein FlhF [Paenibacillus lautus]MEC0255963.1 flagellar biosynthesis protein FlhF [Paenibacillus lautus]MEC0310250.1 flagellar biosynthesis protein FlhF [Paenibacillus lautus]